MTCQYYLTRNSFPPTLTEVEDSTEPSRPAGGLPPDHRPAPRGPSGPRAGPGFLQPQAQAQAASAASGPGTAKTRRKERRKRATLLNNIRDTANTENRVSTIPSQHGSSSLRDRAAAA